MSMGSGRILGLDHLPSTDRVKKFAYCILDNLGQKEAEGTTNINDLPRLIKSKNIETLAIDNIFEIYPHPNEIINFLKHNPIRLIQVTGKPGSMLKLSFLAREHGLALSGKLTPQKSAEIAAQLALMGVGAEVRVFEDVTKVIISRARSLGEGGQHQVKYARSIASIILQLKRKIERKLDENGLLYEVFVREGDMGLKGAKFLIYAPYNIVRGIIKSKKGDMYQIKVMPVTSEKIHFAPLLTKRRGNRYLICGIDPGDYTGLALIDLNGQIVHLESKKEWSLLDVLNRIYEFGNPVIISTDVPKVPQTIEKISKKTKATIFHPNKILSIAEKHELVRQLNADVKNSHERDALAAAFIAYKRYRNILEKVDMILSYLPFNINPDLVKRDVIMGKSIKESIIKQFNLTIGKIIEQSKQIESRKNDIDSKLKDLKEERTTLLKRISELHDRIKRLEERIETLEKEKDEKERLIEKLNEKLMIAQSKLMQKEQKLNEILNYMDEDKLKHEIIQLRNKLIEKNEEIKELRKEVEKFKIIALRKPSDVLVKVIKRLTIDEIEYLSKEIGISPGDVIYIVDPSGGGKKASKKLIALGIRAIILGDDTLPEPAREEFEKANIPIISSQEIVDKLKDLEPSDIKIISKKLLNKLINEMKRREKEKDSTLEKIEELINIYRTRRRNGASSGELNEM
ncbi:MAG: DUF460 domain-containing protein [Candidatus Njordarchaeia archaeon]